MPDAAWVENRHPDFATWTALEKRQRASYTARVIDLAPYLIPYIFEKEEGSDFDPAGLSRASLGYGFGLNESYLSDIFGHVRNAAGSYTWGPLVAKDGDTPIQGDPPAGSIAASLWGDITMSNTSWRNFFMRRGLEWLLTSLGGFIVVDAPPGRARSAKEDASFRPYTRFVPMSSVPNFGPGRTGFRWIRFLESVDERKWDDADNAGIQDRHVVYSLEKYADDSVHTILRRFDEKGTPIPPANLGETNGPVASVDGNGVDLGTFFDFQGEPTMPIVQVAYGETPGIAHVGGGLLQGLDDIILDAFNTVSEMREGYRDEVFAPFVHVGPKPEKVRDLLVEGTKFLALGDEENVSLDRLTADVSSVTAGKELIDLALNAWKEAAKSNAADAQVRAMSGIALQAEFQLSLAPLLREVTETLDDLESNVMHRAAQFADSSATVDGLATIGVARNTQFRPEDEASRLARIVKDARDGFGRIPSADYLTHAFMRWVEASDSVELDAVVQVQGPNGTVTQTLRDLIESQAGKGFTQAIEAQRNRDQSAVPLFGG
jgi:hypothetical protein